MAARGPCAHSSKRCDRDDGAANAPDEHPGPSRNAAWGSGRAVRCSGLRERGTGVQDTPGRARPLRLPAVLAGGGQGDLPQVTELRCAQPCPGSLRQLVLPEATVARGTSPSLVSTGSRTTWGTVLTPHVLAETTGPGSGLPREAAEPHRRRVFYPGWSRRAPGGHPARALTGGTRRPRSPFRLPGSVSKRSVSRYQECSYD